MHRNLSKAAILVLLGILLFGVMAVKGQTQESWPTSIDNSEFVNETGPWVPFVYYPQSQSRGTTTDIYSDGSKIGIGTFSPGQKLDIAAGNIEFDNNGYGIVSEAGARVFTGPNGSTFWMQPGNSTAQIAIFANYAGSAEVSILNDGTLNVNENMIRLANGGYGLITAGGAQIVSGSGGGTFQVYPGNTQAHIMDFYNYQGTAMGQLFNNGDLWIAGALTQNSDMRLKENVVTIDHALDRVLALNGVYFTWRADNSGERQIGVIAQDVEEVLPELVSTNPSGLKAVQYSNLTAVLIEAVKEQQTEIEALQAQNAALEERLTKLEEMFAEMQNAQE